mgnify:CR=1 FL=1
MDFRKFIVAAFGVFIVPLALLSFGAARNGSLTKLLAEPGFLLSNWLYMVAPHLLVVLFAIVVRSARRYFLTWSLIALSSSLTAFQCWVWWWVPPGESSLVWLLYIPLSAIVLVLVAVVTVWWQCVKPPLQRTASGGR